MGDHPALGAIEPGLCVASCSVPADFANVDVWQAGASQETGTTFVLGHGPGSFYCYPVILKFTPTLST